VALIGFEYSGCELHAVWYKNIPEINLVAAVDSNVERARKAAERFGAETSTDDWRKIINNPAVDVVHVNVPPSLNKDIAVAAAGAGKHILCEKPMATNLKDADEMIAAAEKNHVTLMIAHVLHFFTVDELIPEIDRRGGGHAAVLGITSGVLAPLLLMSLI